MTVIAAVVHEGTVHMGADSMVIGDRPVMQAHPKVLRLGPLLIGVSGAMRILDLLEFGLDLPEPGRTERPDRYVRWTVGRAVRQLVQEGTHVDTRHGREDAAFEALIGFEGALYLLGSDFAVTRVATPYEAIGSGQRAALGALYATDTLAPVARLEVALAAAVQFDENCRPPSGSGNCR
ncbi:hypothetical protein [Deinococcus multiflagellatus]|uniref:Uncharacterized protein n=1 Tax=Deinococcus multiflagellatus TaxID=1656887 RepID=A0ABW1ZTA1_9DEIO